MDFLKNYFGKFRTLEGIAKVTTGGVGLAIIFGLNIPFIRTIAIGVCIVAAVWGGYQIATNDSNRT